MDGSMIILIILLLFLIIGIVILIFINTKLRSDLIDPKKCPIVNGDFGVNGGKSYNINSGIGGQLATISRCDGIIPGQSICTKKVNNINDAIIYCNTYSSFCDAFVYSFTNKEVTIVDPKQSLVSDVNYDLYQRQYSIKK